ncbi:MAG TPA: S-methyl-5'-thioadenosine phosphorylase [Nitrospiria bacterium]|nr:S-methyl-5'-thioadenosine phosphorylase [Nitrospiria bacterium]
MPASRQHADRRKTSTARRAGPAGPGASAATIGVIGGSGLYQIESLRQLREVRVRTPFGAPSDAYLVGELSGVKIAFLSRHGRGHRLMPTEINYRANLFGLKQLGVRQVISVSAVGSMKESRHPGEIVIPDQFIDLTKQRVSTFLGRGVVGHVGFGDPVCPELAARLEEAGGRIGATVHRGGTYVCIEGPQFSTRAESDLYRSWGVDVIGMTNATEAKLAREAQLCYATVALITDYDCWHQTVEPVTVEAILQLLHLNAELAKRLIAEAVPKIPEVRACACGSALRDAIVTRPDAITAETGRLLAVLKR